MSNLSDTERFLQELFPDWQNRVIFAHTPGGKWTHTRSLDALDASSDCYVSIAAFGPSHLERKKHRALEVVFLVIDDVGTKVPEAAVEKALGRPTFSTCTSVDPMTGVDNRQWAYRLSAPVAVNDWSGFAKEIEKLIGVPLDSGYTDAVHVFRLPMGVNTRKGGCPVELVEVNIGNKINIGGISPMSGAGSSGGVSGPGPSSVGGRPCHSYRDMVGLAALIPNDVKLDRDAWQTRGHWFAAVAMDPDAAWQGFDAWSQKASSWYDAGDTAKLWEGLKPIYATGRDLLAEAAAADAEGYRLWLAREAAMAFDDGVAPPEVPPRGEVKFLRGKKNVILSMMENAKRAIAGLGLVCRYDEFHHRAFIERPDGTVVRVDDKQVLMLRDEITGAYGKEFGLVHVGEALMTLAYLNGFNPVVEMLAEAEKNWDGVKRLDRLGPDYFHSEKSKLAEQCFRKVMIAAVRRARRPGCKFDQILVLESPEGWDKSTAWSVLAGESNFSDADILSKDAKAVQEELADIWIHEIADLAGLSRADVDHVKAFASRTNDRARPAYGRFLLDQPRQSIEVGTTNAEAYLVSITGNRRFWTFKLSARVDIAKLTADRLALWGEAAAAETAGESLVLDEKLWGDAALAQEERRVVDPWEDELMNLPDVLLKDVSELGTTYQTISNVAIHDHLGGHRGAALNSSSGRKIAEIMKRLGWERTYLKDAVGVKVRGYRRRTDNVSSVPASVPKNIF